MQRVALLHRRKRLHQFHDVVHADVDLVDHFPGIVGQRHAAAGLLHAGCHAGNRRRHALLDRFGHAFDLGRRLARLFRQRAHFVGDHGKTAPVLTGVGGFEVEAILRMATGSAAQR